MHLAPKAQIFIPLFISCSSSSRSHVNKVERSHCHTGTMPSTGPELHPHQAPLGPHPYHFQQATCRNSPTSAWNAAQAQEVLAGSLGGCCWWAWTRAVQQPKQPVSRGKMVVLALVTGLRVSCRQTGSFMGCAAWRGNQAALPVCDGCFNDHGWDFGLYLLNRKLCVCATCIHKLLQLYKNAIRLLLATDPSPRQHVPVLSHRPPTFPNCYWPFQCIFLLCF